MRIPASTRVSHGKSVPMCAGELALATLQETSSFQELLADLTLSRSSILKAVELATTASRMHCLL